MMDSSMMDSSMMDSSMMDSSMMGSSVEALVARRACRFGVGPTRLTSRANVAKSAEWLRTTGLFGRHLGACVCRLSSQPLTPSDPPSSAYLVCNRMMCDRLSCARARS